MDSENTREFKEYIEETGEKEGFAETTMEAEQEGSVPAEGVQVKRSSPAPKGARRLHKADRGRKKPR